MTTALARTRALLDTPAPDPIPGQLDLTRSDMTDTCDHCHQTNGHHVQCPKYQPRSS